MSNKKRGGVGLEGTRPPKRVKYKATYRQSPIWNEESSSYSVFLPREVADEPAEKADDPFRLLTKQTWFSARVKKCANEPELPWTSVERRLTEGGPSANAGKKKENRPRKEKTEEEMKAKYEADLKAYEEYLKKREEDLAKGVAVTSRKKGKPRTPEQKKATLEKKKAKVPTTRSRKALLELTTDQRAKLLRWMGCARMTYNACVAHSKANPGCKMDLAEVRRLFVNNNSAFVAESAFLKEIPYEVREEPLASS